jgi:hypothetical protein
LPSLEKDRLIAELNMVSLVIIQLSSLSGRFTADSMRSDVNLRRLSVRSMRLAAYYMDTDVSEGRFTVHAIRFTVHAIRFTAHSIRFTEYAIRFFLHYRR